MLEAELSIAASHSGLLGFEHPEQPRAHFAAIERPKAPRLRDLNDAVVQQKPNDPHLLLVIGSVHARATPGQDILVILTSHRLRMNQSLASLSVQKVHEFHRSRELTRRQTGLQELSLSLVTTLHLFARVRHLGVSKFSGPVLEKNILRRTVDECVSCNGQSDVDCALRLGRRAVVKGNHVSVATQTIVVVDARNHEQQPPRSTAKAASKALGQGVGLWHVLSGQ